MVTPTGKIAPYANVSRSLARAGAVDAPGAYHAGFLLDNIAAISLSATKSPCSVNRPCIWRRIVTSVSNLDQVGQPCYLSAMTKVNLYEAKTQLSKLVERAAAGEDIVIAKNGKPVAVLVAPEKAASPPPKRIPEFGFLKDEWPLTQEQMDEADRYLEELLEKSANEEI
jgi:prevent-host-death family protein